MSLSFWGFVWAYVQGRTVSFGEGRGEIIHLLSANIDIRKKYPPGIPVESEGGQ